jgi:hypothetical protein
MEYSKCSLFSFTIFFDLEKIIFDIFNIAENNIINSQTGQGTKLSNKEMGGPPERRQIFVDKFFK